MQLSCVWCLLPTTWPSSSGMIEGSGLLTQTWASSLGLGPIACSILFHFLHSSHEQPAGAPLQSLLTLVSSPHRKNKSSSASSLPWSSKPLTSSKWKTLSFLMHKSMNLRQIEPYTQLSTFTFFNQSTNNLMASFYFLATLYLLWKLSKSICSPKRT